MRLIKTLIAFLCLARQDTYTGSPSCAARYWRRTWTNVDRLRLTQQAIERLQEISKWPLLAAERNNRHTCHTTREIEAERDDRACMSDVDRASARVARSLGYRDRLRIQSADLSLEVQEHSLACVLGRVRELFPVGSCLAIEFQGRLRSYFHFPHKMPSHCIGETLCVRSQHATVCTRSLTAVCPMTRWRYPWRYGPRSLCD